MNKYTKPKLEIVDNTSEGVFAASGTTPDTPVVNITSDPWFDIGNQSGQILPTDDEEAKEAIANGDYRLDWGQMYSYVNVEGGGGIVTVTLFMPADYILVQDADGNELASGSGDSITFNAADAGQYEVDATFSGNFNHLVDWNSYEPGSEGWQNMYRGYFAIKGVSIN